MWRRVLGAVVVALNFVGAACHGFLAEPAARNVVHNSNYCPHCLAAGGPGVTFAGGRTWPNSKHGACGNPHTGPLDHEAGGKFATGKITGTYRAGQRVTLRVKITAPHGGRFSFGLCPVPEGASAAAERAAVTQACFDRNRLKNAEDGTPYWWFGKRGTGEYTMDFVLPPAITCKRCVLQWHYETGNSCTIPGTPQQHVMSASMVSCDKTSVMEEFWNCADVSVTGGGGGEPGTVAPPGGKRTRAPRPKQKPRRETFVNPGQVNETVVLAALAAVAIVAVLPAAVAVGGVLAALVLAGRPRRRVAHVDRAGWYASAAGRPAALPPPSGARANFLGLRKCSAAALRGFSGR